MSFYSLSNSTYSTPSVFVRKKYVVILFALLLLFFLSLISYYNLSDEMPSDCIFCQITQHKVPETKIEVETDDFVIFKDIKPASTNHYLAVPKRHIDSIKTANKTDEELVQTMATGLKEFFEAKKINVDNALFGFHMPPFISVKHLHLHGIAPRSSMSYFNRFIFNPGSPFFKSVDEALSYIREKAQREIPGLDDRKIYLKFN